MNDQYWRAADIYNVVDGDTIDAVVDVGFRRATVERLRLLGVNAPEMHAADPIVRAEAAGAKMFVQTWLTEHLQHNASTLTWGRTEVHPFYIQSAKGDSFGRWLAVVQCQLGHDLATDLLAAGLAVPFR